MAASRFQAIAFELFWVRLSHEVPELAAHQDEMLPELYQSLAPGAAGRFRATAPAVD